MRIKHIAIGAVVSFVLLLIVGGIFAIKAEPGNEDSVGNVGNSPTSSQQVTDSQNSNLAPSNNSTFSSDADPAAIGYTVLASTDLGRAIYTQKPQATTIQAAIVAALHDLSRILDSRPTVQGAFADAQQQHRGGATFTGTLKGQSIKGSIVCGIGDQGAAITVIYDRADAPVASWAKLSASLPTDSQMQQQSIGDGAATVSVPPGWRILNSSNLGSTLIAGPDQQKVSLGIGLEVVTPDSVAAAAQRQLAESGQLSPAVRLLVAPYTGPVDALKNLTSQLSEMSQTNGGPTFTLDQILQSDPVAAQLPSGHAARIYFSSTNTQNGQSVHMRNWMQMECYPVGDGTWGIICSQVAAPDATFDRDLPTMIAIAKSWKLNDSVVAEHGNQNVAASNARFAAFENSQKEKQDAFDDYLHSVQHNELITERGNADFDEVIRGYRTIYDTESGERSSADLGNINEIVNSLNRSDPGRYVQIPLRDEQFPLNQGQ